MIVDFHSHFLPAIDDGAQSPEVSVQMVNISKSQNVDILVATPHYSINNATLNVARIKREGAYKAFREAAAAAGAVLPEIRLGFEVRNSIDLLLIDDLDALCIEGTKTLLLEMPMSKWHTPHFENIEILIHKGYNVLLAHIERYLDSERLEDVGRLLDMNLYAQVSASAFMSVQNRGILLDMLENDMFHVLGSDAHNTTSRSSFMDVACRVISSQLGDNYIEKMSKTSEFLLTAPTLEEEEKSGEI